MPSVGPRVCLVSQTQEGLCIHDANLRGLAHLLLVGDQITQRARRGFDVYGTPVGWGRAKLKTLFLVRLGGGGGAGLRLVNLVADRGCLRSSRPGFTEGDNRPPMTLGPQAHLNQSSPLPRPPQARGRGLRYCSRAQGQGTEEPTPAPPLLLSLLSPQQEREAEEISSASGPGSLSR